MRFGFCLGFGLAVPLNWQVPLAPLGWMFAPLLLLACNGEASMIEADSGVHADGGTLGRADSAIDTCNGVVCNTPPENHCKTGTQIFVQYNSVGTCDGQGECTYQSTEQTCADGCIEGRCLNCTDGTHLEGTACVSSTRACTIANGQGEEAWNGSAWGPCTPASCDDGYHIDGASCVSSTRSCVISNGSAEQTWDGSKWGPCTPTSCWEGYHIEGSGCSYMSEDCTVENGRGRKHWDGSAWGPCMATSCNSGYRPQGEQCVQDLISCDLQRGTCYIEPWGVSGWYDCSDTTRAVYVHGCDSCLYNFRIPRGQNSIMRGSCRYELR